MPDPIEPRPLPRSILNTYDYDYDDDPCPNCGHEPTHRRLCQNLDCDDGFIDCYDEDPLWYDPGDTEICPDCQGTGVERWCPKCGYNLQRSHSAIEDT